MQASDPTFPLFPIFAFLAFVLSVIPLSWHLQAWNSGTCAFMIWVGAFCLVEFINSIIWSDNAINSVPVWCDITSQIIAGAGVGIPASILCISRRLYRIISTQTVSITREDKRRAIYEDLAIAFGIPLLVLILHIIVQPHRFDIFEEYGCSPATYNTIPAYFLFYMWPILIGLVSFVFSSLTLRSFYLRRIQFNQIISSNNAINPSRYIRLMLLALIDIMCTVPIGIYIIYIDLKGIPLAPWISWDDTHFDFGRVILVPAVIWRSNSVDNAAIQVNRWLPIICAFVFFMIFGFAEEAMKNYRRAFWFLAKPLGFRPSSEGGSISTKGKFGLLSGLKKFKLKSDDGNTLPVYVPTTSPASPFTRDKNRKSYSEAESRSTICFPDDDVEMGPYGKSLPVSTSSEVPLSPSSTSYPSSTLRTPITPNIAPPSYADSTHLNVESCSLPRRGEASRSPSLRAASWVTLPDMIIECSEHISRPSSYSRSSVASYGTHLPDLERGEDEDDISITDAYMDSHPTSPVTHHVYRAPTPVPLAPSNLPTPPPPALAFHRPFSPPSVYPITQPHLVRDANGSNGILVTVHTQSSRESL